MCYDFNWLVCPSPKSCFGTLSATRHSSRLAVEDWFSSGRTRPASVMTKSLSKLVNNCDYIAKAIMTSGIFSPISLSNVQCDSDLNR